MWLVLPSPASAKSHPSADLALNAGTAGGDTALGGVEGGYFNARIPAHLLDGANASKQMSAQRLTLLKDTLAEFHLLASSSDGALADLRVECSEWTDFRDEHGSARLPLRERFVVATEERKIEVDFRPTLEQFFRIPVDLGGERVFSDFRAVGTRVRVTLEERGATVLDEWVNDGSNAVEYAYTP